MLLKAAVLQSINIPTGMSALNESIFENTGLTSIVIPANINTLNNTAFKNVSNLQTVTFSAASISLSKFRF